MHDKRRRFEFRSRYIGRPLLISSRIGPWRSFELPGVKPQLLSSSKRGDGVEHSIMRNQTFESRGVAEDPVDHVSAIRRTHRALTISIDKRIRLLDIVESSHEIHKWL